MTSKAGLIRLGLLTGAAAALEAGCRAGWVDPHAVIPPSAMAEAAWAVLQLAEVRSDLRLTFSAVAGAVVLALIVGGALGLGLHASPRTRRVLDPLLASYYAVPTFVFYPVFIVMFGLNRWPLVAIGFVFAVVAVALCVHDGLARVPPVLRRTARAMRLGALQTLLTVVLPAASPYFLTALKLAVVYALVAVIAGEFILSGEGVGFRIAFAYQSFDNRTMYGLLLVLFVLIGVLVAALSSWEQRQHARLR